ncbi:MAG: hypothetical protein M1812_006631 [Candelaria pacifica]|nr:MAG: hypothetical protein M1812_006631 [Candelaria pacifica]
MYLETTYARGTLYESHRIYGATHPLCVRIATAGSSIAFGEAEPLPLGATAADLADGVHDATGNYEANNEYRPLANAADLAAGVHDANRSFDADDHRHENYSPPTISQENEQRQQEALADDYWAECWQRRLLGVHRAGLFNKWMTSRDQWTVPDEERARDGVIAAFREEMGVFVNV